MDDPAEVSQMVVVMSLGMCTAIVAGSLSIEDAERRLFNPQVLARLTELEDVQSLVPDRLGESLAQI